MVHRALWCDCARDFLCPGHPSLLQCGTYLVHDTLEHDMEFYGNSARHATVFVILLLYQLVSIVVVHNSRFRVLCTEHISPQLEYVHRVTFMTSSTDYCLLFLALSVYAPGTTTMHYCEDIYVQSNPVIMDWFGTGMYVLTLAFIIFSMQVATRREMREMQHDDTCSQQDARSVLVRSDPDSGMALVQSKDGRTKWLTVRYFTEMQPFQKLLSMRSY